MAQQQTVEQKRDNKERIATYHQSCLHVASEWILEGRMILSDGLRAALYTLDRCAGVLALAMIIAGVKRRELLTKLYFFDNVELLH